MVGGGGDIDDGGDHAGGGGDRPGVGKRQMPGYRESLSLWTRGPLVVAPLVLRCSQTNNAGSGNFRPSCPLLSPLLLLPWTCAGQGTWPCLMPLARRSFPPTTRRRFWSESKVVRKSQTRETQPRCSLVRAVTYTRPATTTQRPRAMIPLVGARSLPFPFDVRATPTPTPTPSR